MIDYTNRAYLGALNDHILICDAAMAAHHPRTKQYSVGTNRLEQLVAE